MPRFDVASAAVVVDRLPLYRIGMRRAAHEAGFSIAGGVADVGEALELVRRSQAGVVLLGDVADAGLPALRRASALAVVVGLVSSAGRRELADVLNAGVAGLGLRSSTVSELADVMRRAVKGERALVPALLPALAGWGPDPGPGAAGLGAAGRPSPAAGELTARERRVLAALAAGASNAEIAAELFVSPATVKTHLAHIYAKLQVSGRQEALHRAVALGLVG